MPKFELKPYTHDELWKFVEEGRAIDRSVFNEMRSNIRLVNGDHYSKLQYNVHRIIERAEDLNEQQKLRITKNYIQKFAQTQKDAILSANPGAGFEAHNPSESQDQKAAQLHHAVWKDGAEKFDFEELDEAFVEDLVDLGEEVAETFFDPNEGEIIGHYAKVDQQGEDLDEPDLSRPVFSGATSIRDIPGYNLLRPRDCKDMKKAQWLGIDEMFDTDELKAKFHDPEIHKLLESTRNEVFQVYDPVSGGYVAAEKQTNVVRMFFQVSPRYPNGHTYFITRKGIIFEDDLPGAEVGMPTFPIDTQKNRRIKGSCRGRSDIKTWRPMQIEINRCSSKMAEHHVTMGDDKVLLFGGAKYKGSLTKPGVRFEEITGPAPVVMPGRDGSQYLGQLEHNVTELHKIAGEPEENAGVVTGTADANVLLYRSAKQKAPHNARIRKHGRFKKRVIKKFLRLQKIYLDDQAFINAVGKNEAINISEFKNSSDMCYEVNVTDQSDDIETKLGQQMMYTQILQYIGNSDKMDSDTLGMIVRLMPYSNGEKATASLTAKYDRAENCKIALDRGERPPVHQMEDHAYMLNSLTSRVLEPGFRDLSPEVQANYAAKIGIHMEFHSENEKMLRLKEQAFIPTTGGLIKCDLYAPKPDDPTKTERLLIPNDAVEWLRQRLAEQGTNTADDGRMSEGVQASLAQSVVGPQPKMQATG